MSTEKKTTSKNTKIAIICAIVLAVVVAAVGLVFYFNSEKPVEGAKSFTLVVLDNAGAEKSYEGHTDQEYLRGALEELEDFTMEGDESEFGLYVKTINGVTADFEKDGSYWAFYVNGEYCNYGVDTQPVLDGDAFRIEYTTE